MTDDNPLKLNGHYLSPIDNRCGRFYVCMKCGIRGPYVSAFEDIEHCN